MERETRKVQIAEQSEGLFLDSADYVPSNNNNNNNNNNNKNLRKARRDDGYSNLLYNFKSKRK